ncbi:MAG TPA: DUF4167 domain-containing protein [Alphaproteobacteria bacterium]
MRHNSRRMNKGRNNGGGPRRGSNVPPRMQVFDSNGPDVRIRGTAWQVHEKYLALAKDAASTGDHVMAESYLQHAEHYQRIINTFAEQMGNWTPQANNSDQVIEGEEGAEMVEGAEGTVQKLNVVQQGQGQQQRPNRDDDLGLPSSLFKAGTDEKALESA